MHYVSECPVQQSIQLCVSVREREKETVGSSVMCMSFSGDDLNERERTNTIKRQIEEELRQLEDEISACKWIHTHSPVVIIGNMFEL